MTLSPNMPFPRKIWVQRAEHGHGPPPRPDICLDSLNLYDIGKSHPEIEFAWFHDYVDCCLRGFDPETELVVGYLQCVEQTLRSVGLVAHKWPTYPDCLRPLLFREVVQVPDILRALMRIETPTFVKPVTNSKAFTGFIAESSEDAMVVLHMDGVPAWTAPVVTWRSEWRVLVAHGRVVDIRRYKGDPWDGPPEQVIRDAMAALASHDVPDGYTFDVGWMTAPVADPRIVAKPGEFVGAVVEFNGGMCFGAYEAFSDAYLAVLWAWWRWNVEKNKAEGWQAPPKFGRAE